MLLPIHNEWTAIATLPPYLQLVARGFINSSAAERVDFVSHVKFITERSWITNMSSGNYRLLEKKNSSVLHTRVHLCKQKDARFEIVQTLRMN